MRCRSSPRDWCCFSHPRRVWRSRSTSRYCHSFLRFHRRHIHWQLHPDGCWAYLNMALLGKTICENIYEEATRDKKLDSEQVVFKVKQVFQETLKSFLSPWVRRHLASKIACLTSLLFAQKKINFSPSGGIKVRGFWPFLFRWWGVKSFYLTLVHPFVKQALL